MKFKSGSVNINFEYFNSFNREKKSVIMIHGYTGSLEDWREISIKLSGKYNFIGIDLIGHGKSDSPVSGTHYSQSAIVKHLDDLLIHLSLDTAILLGYSMGGRAALCYAAKYPKKLNALLLESASPGIANAKVRDERIKTDEELADYLETQGLEKFADLWMDKQIFNTQLRFSNEKLKNLKNKRMLNTTTGLANSLRGFSTGKMTDISKTVKSILCPVLLITGKLDTKITSLNSQLKQNISNSKHAIIQNAGHNTHLEEPERFVKVVNGFLNSI